MSTHRLGPPAEVRRQLEYRLPRQGGLHPPTVRVTPRDREEHRCPAYAADHYEVHAYYVRSDTGSLGPLEEALRAVPGVYLTTQVRSHPSPLPGNIFTNPTWPPALGTARRDRDDLRVQVIALIANPDGGVG
jgi:hypothetical protein